MEVDDPQGLFSRALSTPSNSSLFAPLSLQFEDPQGQVVFERHGASDADFHFTSNGEGEYKLCFTAKGEWAHSR